MERRCYCKSIAVMGPPKVGVFMIRRSIKFSLLLSCALPVVAHAQEAPEDRPTDIVVIASGQSQATSATKSDTPIVESPQTISIINRDEIDLRASPTIADALSYTAGVQAEPSGIDSRTDEVSVRGFGAGGFSSNNNFVDGLRLPTGGQWTRPGFDPFALQQIEVLKGPSGALYGQSAPGGIVNIVSKRPSFTPHGEVLLQGAGYTGLSKWSYQGAADMTGPLSDTVAVRMVALARYGETQVDDVKIGRQYISPSVTWKPGENTTWTLMGQYQRDEGGATFQFLPRLGALVPANGGYIDQNANIGEPNWNTFDRNQYLAASFFEQKFGDGRFALRNNTRYTHLDTIYRVVVLSGDTLTACPVTIAGCIPNQTVNRRAVQGIGESDGWATDTQLEARVDTGPMEHVLLGGFDYFHTEWEHYRDLVNSALVLPVLDILNPVSRGSAGFANALSPQIYTETVSSQKGAYLQDQISLGDLRVTFGGRYDWANDNTYNPVNGRRFINKNEKFTWRAGAVYLHSSGLAPYVSYATSFLPQVNDPSTSLTGEPFVPTTGQQWEAGLRYQGARGIYVTLGGYQITQQNIVTPATAVPPATTAPMCGTSTCQVQTGEGQIRGIELEAKASLPWGMSVIAAGSRQWTEITESTVTYAVPGVTGTLQQQGNELPQIPSWLLSLFLDQRIRSGALAGFGFGGGVRYTGKSWGDSNNTLRIPDYTLFDLFVRYDLGEANPELDGLTLSVNARNIADKRFVATCTATSACYYGQGRSVIGRLQFKW